MHPREQPQGRPRLRVRRPSARETGRIEVGNTAGAPFTTNATGVATGLNADKVDGKEAADFAAATDVTALSASLLVAQVAADGTLGANGRGPRRASVTRQRLHGEVQQGRRRKCSFTASPVGSPSRRPPRASTATPNTADSVNVDADRGRARSTFR